MRWRFASTLLVRFWVGNTAHIFVVSELLDTRTLGDATSIIYYSQVSNSDLLKRRNKVAISCY